MQAGHLSPSGRSRFAAAGAVVAFAMTVLLASARSSAIGTVYKPPDGSYTVTLPDGWTQIPDAEVTQMQSAIRRPGSKGIQFRAMFQSPDNPSFTYPYAALQEIPYPGGKQPTDKDVADLLKGMGARNVQQATAAELKPEVQSLVSGAALGTAKYDAATKTFQLPLTMNVAGIGKIQGLSMGHFGRHKAVLIHYYARADDFPNQQATINDFASSFRFASDQEYNTAYAAGQRIGRIAVLVGAVVVLLIVVAVVLAIVRRSRKQPAPARPGMYPGGAYPGSAYLPPGGYAPPPPGQYPPRR